MTAGKSILNRAHGSLVFGRRVRVLAQLLAKQIPAGAHVLDVGTGDGSIAAAVAAQRPDVKIEGIDVLIRPTTHILVRPFDGEHIPLGNDAVDVVSLVDVLHHTEDPRRLLRESIRVSRRHVLIKDHLREGLFAGATLRLMDWVGNYGHNVVLPYNYLSENEWGPILRDLNLNSEHWIEELGLYPFPLSMVFGRRLHFIALFTVPSGDTGIKGRPHFLKRPSSVNEFNATSHIALPIQTG
jgi:SAM-dependent methyltransferase